MNTLTEEAFTKIKREAPSRIIGWTDKSDRNLSGYGNEKLQVTSTFYTSLFIDEWRPAGKEKFYVIKGAARSLLGRSTAIRYSVLRLGRGIPVPATDHDSSSDIFPGEIFAIQKQYPKFKIAPVQLKIDPSVPPSRSSYTNIPFAWKSKARNRISEMEATGIIEKVTGDMKMDHCSSMLAVPKGTDDFRLVVDLRGPNRCIIREPHAMPTLDLILAELHGCEWFSTIDLSNAFFHIEIENNSRHVTNFYSGDGFYRFRRLPFGLCNAPDIFQSTMEQILAGIEGVLIYLDDILIFAKDREEHDKRLAAVMRVLNTHSVKLNKEKCSFAKNQVVFLGFQIGSGGYCITSDRMEAITNFRTPSSVAEVRSFLGMLIYVERFILCRADKTKNLQSMVREGVFRWDKECQDEFDFLRLFALKQIKKLGYYKQGDKTELIVDASPHGLGAVLVQLDPDNKSRIIACASRALSRAERIYPQVQREALAIVWAVKRFQFYVRGQEFTIKTDNEGNEFIFGEAHKLGRRCVTRAEAWALQLQPFKFKIEHIPSDQNIADVFSRLVQTSEKDEPFDDFSEHHLLLVDSRAELPVTVEEIAKSTESDGDLIAVKEALSSGNWKDVPEKFSRHKLCLSSSAGLVFFKNKMIVPASVRDKTLRLAHKGHFGMNATKRLLRQFVWWPNINAEVEIMIGKCEPCQLVVHVDKPVPLSSRNLPDEPWSVLQMDFLKLTGCGELLIVIDTYSRMTWAIEMARGKSDEEATLKALTKIFRTWGFPKVLQSDNGPPFNAKSFSEFWRQHGVCHDTVVPWSPWMNGMVERANEGIIKAAQVALINGSNWRDAVQEYVSAYNNLIPHPTTGSTPFELMTGRLFRGCFPFVRSAFSTRSDELVRARDAAAKNKSIDFKNAKRHATSSSITEGDWVWVANKTRKNKLDSFYIQKKFWVVERNGPRVRVASEDGQVFDRWVSDLKKTNAPPEEIQQGDSVTENRKGRSAKTPPVGWKAHRYKVLMRDGDDVAVRSENGDGRAVRLSELKKVEKFGWNVSGQDLDLPVDPSTIDDSNLTKPDEKTKEKRFVRKPKKYEDFIVYNIFG